jgi:RND family efflux transporter MFP subunit
MTSRLARLPATASLAALVALLPLAAACDTSSAAPGAKPGAPPPAGVQLTTLATTDVRDATEYIATLRSRRSIAIQPQVDGQITKIWVASGDRVINGQPLAQIDSARAQASVSAAEATRASRLATLALARRELERTTSLVEKGALTGQALDQARSGVEAAQADVDALTAQIQSSQVQLRYYRLVAPAVGVVGDIPVRVGDRVTPATVITTLDNNDALEAYVSIPVERAAQVKVGTAVELVGDDGANLATGQVYFISPQVNADTQSVLVKATFTNATGGLRAEQFVRARVVWSNHPGILIPALSVVRLAGQTFVFVAETTPDGKTLVAKQRPVTLGELTGDSFPVEKGLAAGDRVVTSGIQKLRDGAPIAPVAPTASAAAASNGARK